MAALRTASMVDRLAQLVRSVDPLPMSASPMCYLVVSIQSAHYEPFIGGLVNCHLVRRLPNIHSNNLARPVVLY